MGPGRNDGASQQAEARQGYRLFWGRSGERLLPGPAIHRRSVRNSRPAPLLRRGPGRRSGGFAAASLATPVRLDDGSIALRVLDLRGSMPFFLDDEVPRRSLVACGPVVLRLGRYVIAGIPFDAEMPASVAAADPANGVPAPANEPAFAPASNGSAEPAPPSAQASSLVGGTSASARRSVSDRPPPTFDASGRGRRARLHQRAERSSKQEGPHSDPRSPAIRAAIKPPAAMARTRMALAPFATDDPDERLGPPPRSVRSGRSTTSPCCPRRRPIWRQAPMRGARSTRPRRSPLRRSPREALG